MGDNLRDFSDLYGDRKDDLGAKAVEDTKADFGTKFIVFPNPMYGEWEKAIYKNDYKKSPQVKDSLRRAVLMDKR
jgi:predicted secreted acid phosphatase